MHLPMGGARSELPLERFKPTTGLLTGWVGVVVGLLVVAYAAVNFHTVAGLRIGTGVLVAVVLVWITQIRPRVTAYPDDLVLHGPLRDTTIPYVAVGHVVMGQTLNVWVSGRRYVCIGIGKSTGYEMRQRVRSMGNSNSLFGPNRAYQFSGGADEADHRQAGMSYHDFVLTRITDLVMAARSRQQDPDAAPPPVRRTYALPEVVALVLTGVAFAISLFLF